MLPFMSCPATLRWVEHGDGGRALVPEASHAGHVLALYLATRGDLVVVGAFGWLVSSEFVNAVWVRHEVARMLLCWPLAEGDPGACAMAASVCTTAVRTFASSRR